jgi:hypothetical protein
MPSLGEHVRKLEIFSAVAAFGAAVFWFISAAGDLPPMASYFGAAPPTDPLYVAQQQGVRMNRWAASFAGASALSMAVATLLRARARRSLRVDCSEDSRV